MATLLNSPKIVGKQAILARYNRMRWQALFGIFIGYAAYYILRNNLLLSSPDLISHFHFTKQDIGFLSGTMLVAYGLSKGIMSVLADRINPKYFMLIGLIMSGLVNIMMGFSTVFWIFFFLCILNGIFQGMGAGPSYVILANWFPHKIRGSATAIFNASHNLGGGLIAPIAGAALAWFGQAHWQSAYFFVPVAFASIIAIIFYFLGLAKPTQEHLPSLNKIIASESDAPLQENTTTEPYSTWFILKNYILTNRNIWYVSFLDAFSYMIRLGVLTWLPLYLLEVKGFSKTEIATTFAIFEWSAIPSTLLAGYVTDTLFKGHRMPLAVLCLIGVAIAIGVYWMSHSLIIVMISAGIVGAFIYVPMFLASLQAIEVVPAFAAGSATGMRGLISYIVGGSAGTALFGMLAEHYGWNVGFYFLFFAVFGAIFCCYMVSRGLKTSK
ncbi:phosphoglycerate transporter [Actinobacillus delphinicola]|uniref:MFS transporter n=1 Tax=Actinobacillus delphinicola TaxID=51161 RepID=UPI0024436801|nr:MFS transporter [Actinobacillus delphinicola]MDG6897378.1 phosphoglycerate transporter [Actinobacillus delphinicola]